MAKKIYRIKVCGILNDIDFQMAKCCAEDLFHKSVDIFKKPSIRGMVELQWSEFIEKEVKKTKDHMWTFTDKALVYLNDAVLGGPKKLICWAEQIDCYENFRPIPLYVALAEQEYKAYMNRNNNTFVYMDFTIDEEMIGRLIIELYEDVVPKTCKNFRLLCTGEMGSTEESEVKLHYKNAIIHRIVPNGWIQGGDIETMKGNDGISIYGKTFEDENFVVSHDRRGVVGMANKGPHTNASQFYITLQPTPWMDTQYVAFGQVIDGSGTLRKIEKQATMNERPLKEVVIGDLGQCPP